MGGRDQRVEVRTEAEERRIAEIEQAGVADDDVEPQAEQDVDQREDAVGEEVTAAHPERQRGGEADEEGQVDGGGRGRPAAGEPDDALAALDTPLMLRDPVVDADAWLAVGLITPSGSRARRGGRSAARGGRR